MEREAYLAILEEEFRIIKQKEEKLQQKIKSSNFRSSMNLK